MATIDSLRKSITEMSEDEGLQHIESIRKARWEVFLGTKAKKKSKKSKRKKKDPLANLSPAQAQKLLNMLKD